MGNLLNSPDGSIRRFERRPYRETLEYSLSVLEVNESKRFDLKGEAIDISDEGICIQTDYPLEPGHKLWFNDGIERAGIVRWCIRVDNRYRAGIRFDKEEDINYLAEEIKEDALDTSKKKAEYVKLLDEAIDQFNKKLEDIEKRCSDREDPDRILNELTKVLTDMSYICEEFERGVDYDKTVIKDARIRFREKTNPIMSKSYCVNRTRTWPQGYQGDYKTLEIAYRNIPLSEGIGYYLDLYLLNSTLAEAVRNRIKKLEEILREEILKREEPSILNVACGSCRELMGLVKEIRDSKAKITCIDNDSDALSFAQNRLSYTDILPQVELYKYNAHRMFDHETNMIEFGMQDIIYSVGYFDYLPDDFLVKMLNSLYRLLNPGGKLIAAFKDAERYRYQDYHWFIDWDGFRQRKVNDFERLLAQAGIPDTLLTATREKSGVIIFYIATK